MTHINKEKNIFSLAIKNFVEGIVARDYALMNEKITQKISPDQEEYDVLYKMIYHRIPLVEFLEKSTDKSPDDIIKETLDKDFSIENILIHHIQYQGLQKYAQLLEKYDYQPTYFHACLATACHQLDILQYMHQRGFFFDSTLLNCAFTTGSMPICHFFMECGLNVQSIVMTDNFDDVWIWKKNLESLQKYQKSLDLYRTLDTQLGHDSLYEFHTNPLEGITNSKKRAKI